MLSPSPSPLPQGQLHWPAATKPPSGGSTCRKGLAPSGKGELAVLDLLLVNPRPGKEEATEAQLLEKQRPLSSHPDGDPWISHIRNLLRPLVQSKGTHLVFSLTQENMKSEEAVQAAWSGYHHPLPTSSRLLSTYEYHPSLPPASSYSELPVNGFRALPIHVAGQGRSRDSPAATAHSPLRSRQSYPSLKRSFDCYKETPYGTGGPEMNKAAHNTEDQPKPTIRPDHRLLSFGHTQDRHAILDQYGRPGSLEINAQIHGMFFLSEIATSSGEAVIIQPELTCYRRNLFQISGSIGGPSGPLSVLEDQGQAILVTALEVSISATESVDGNVIRLVVIPWKTPPPNSPDLPRNQDQEPPPIPLPDHAEGGQRGSSEVAVHPIAWRRLQFRVATANNGRRKELQQHFVLRLSVNATLANNSKLCLAEAVTAPIVVRGRSPRNFQARKEIPLLGSSASPRGKTSQNSPVETFIAPGAANSRGQSSHSPDVPKRHFQFDPSNFVPPTQPLKQGFDHWTSAQQRSELAIVTKGSYPPSQMAMPEYSHAGLSNVDILHPSTSPSLLHASDGSGRSQAFQFASAPPTSSVPIQFMDDNPTPAKSSRRSISSEIPAVSTYLPYQERCSAPYSTHPSASDPALSARDYFSATSQADSWSAAENGNVIYTTTTTMPPPPLPNYTYHSETFAKDNPQPDQYTWGAAQ